ncbi:MAG: hypothetical protein WCI89_00260 [bacterium]
MAFRKKKKNADAVDDLKSALYSRTETPDIDPVQRTSLSMQDVHVPTAWGGEQPHQKSDILQFMQMKKKQEVSFATKFFITSALFFVGAMGVAAYMFFFGGNTISPQNIDMQIVAPSVIDGGKPTTFQILINNRNQVPLQMVDLLLDYPQTTRDPADQSQALVHARQSLGTVFSGQALKRTASAIFYGQEGASQKVLATLQYNIPGSNAIFTKQTELDFIVGSSPVSLVVSMPSEAIANQQFGSDVTITNNSNAPIHDTVLEGQYPFGFAAMQATPAADVGQNFWRLGTLESGASKTIHLDGSIDGQDGDQRVFTFLVGSDSDVTDTHVKTPFLSVPQTLTVHQSFITAHIAINGVVAKTVAVSAGQVVQGAVTWQNNLPDTVSNLQLVLSLAGPMLDAGSIQTSSGFYQSANSTITWSKDQLDVLAHVPPGGSGSFPFSFSVLSPGAGGTVYTNPTINLNVAVSGTRQGGDAGVPQTVSSAATTQVSVSSALALAASATHYSGSFQNTGPMPPVAEQTTSYTVVWTIRNSSNSIGGAAVSATLPPYVQFRQADGMSGITYDKSSRTVSWNIGNIKAGVGYSAPALTGSFQVNLSPSASQVGQAPALTSDVTLVGQDRFAQVGVNAQASAPTTALLGDSGFTSSMGQVAPKQ